MSTKMWLNLIITRLNGKSQTQYILYDSMIQKQAKLMKGDKVVGGGYLLGGSTGDVYLDLGGGYMCIYICKNLSSCTFKIWAL